ncbi:hypothetical protein F2Q70_00005411 [Brassica cretica]|uniref:Uncharacterized protein n=1 Tax=Brassica cretica TaxID=69181 RepID=A0A8S9J5M6_BRACR|nr:hypothetical protein F2Q70_00005411 [Brassica cretica]
MHRFVSYRRFGKARSLCNDRNVHVLGHYVANKFGSELSRYVVTVPCACLVATCFAMLQGFSVSPAFEKHSGLTTGVGSQNYCSCLDANNLICDRGIRTEVSRKFVHGKKRFSSECFVKCWPSEIYFVHFEDDVFTQIAKDVVGQGLDHGTLIFKAKFARVIRANMADSRRKRFSALGRRSPRGLLHNQRGVSGGMTAFSDVTEGKERQKPASRRAKK